MLSPLGFPNATPSTKNVPAFSFSVAFQKVLSPLSGLSGSKKGKLFTHLDTISSKSSYLAPRPRNCPCSLELRELFLHYSILSSIYGFIGKPYAQTLKLCSTFAMGRFAN